MFRTEQAQRLKIPEVFLSPERVIASKAHSVISKGFRLATLEEVTLRYRYDANFRRKLWEDGAAWTSQKGLGSSNCHEISGGGEHLGVAESRFYNDLTPEQRSYHYPGNGSVAVCVDGFDFRSRGLFVIAAFGSSDEARAAYVKDDREAATAQSILR